MNKKLLIAIIVILVIIFILVFGLRSCMQKKPPHLSPQEIVLPLIKDSSAVVYHTAYTLMYDEKYEQADWVAYILTRQHLQSKKVKRSNRFKADPLVHTGSAAPDDYKNSGYDRGHLAPAADMSWSKITMLESFFMSNMSPQLPSFNRGVWKRLEEKVRRFAIDYDTLYVITGPVLKDGLPAIGESVISVPEFYYKVILVYSTSEIKAIGFILPNGKSNKKLYRFAVTVDSVESVTGIDFYNALPDDIENDIESRFELSEWQF